ncbi:MULTISPECIES: type VII secretion-associated serine protease mycosin [Mycobacteroides]|uniref:type VII secretion-associated serine protease mycosin n=2 Tax=Mycobacteriaceae TaxID=1762 RepID=UPI0009BFC937|nr:MULTISPECIES: type VII secretion-associated serine protease mycosin [Mycobacteroides]
MSMLVVRTAAVFGVVALVVASGGGGTAAAIPPPIIDAGAVPPDTVGPERPMQQRVQCQTPGVLPASNFADPPPGWRLLNLEATRPFATGAGVAVAVIDTGVTPNPRLPHLRPGGDYVMDGDGLSDCDAHGTLVAGVIGAAPAPGDAFVGVAPEATLISIRQSSTHFNLQNPTQSDDPNDSETGIDLRAEARAVVHAVNLGASVINISMVSCLKAVRHADDSALGAAVHWAVNERNVVVVAAAGNTGGDCKQNPAPPGTDPGSWANVVTISSPSWWADDVLSVGSVQNDGAPSSTTLQGPWVDLAAPGENVVSVGNFPDGRLVNALPGEDQVLVPLFGDSYSAAVVTGVVALVRQKFPELTARQVMYRLKATAHAGPTTPDPAIGWGVVDPLAALTWNVPNPAPMLPVNSVIHPAPPPPGPDYQPRRFASYGLGGLAVVVVLAGGAWAALRRRDRKVRGKHS